jgi:hypothetical protein
MSLRETVAAPFRREGTDRVGVNAFIVDLSLKRDWFTPDQAKRLVDIAASEGLVDREDDQLVAAFDPREVPVPEGFVPDEGVLQRRSTFEHVLDAVTATGVEKQTAVANVNRLQGECGLTLEAAAVLYARSVGVDVTDLADRALGEL